MNASVNINQALKHFSIAVLWALPVVSLWPNHAVSQGDKIVFELIWRGDCGSGGGYSRCNSAYRAKVFGGWLVVYKSSQGESEYRGDMRNSNDPLGPGQTGIGIGIGKSLGLGVGTTFVPDENHEWNLEPLAEQ